MQDSYRKQLWQRVRHILRGPVEVAAAVVGLLVIFSRPLMDWVLEIWEGLPWWVGAFLLVFLVSYAFVRAGYELWKEEQQAREKAEAQLESADQERDALRQENEELIAEVEEAEASALSASWKE